MYDDLIKTALHYFKLIIVPIQIGIGVLAIKGAIDYYGPTVFGLLLSLFIVWMTYIRVRNVIRMTVEEGREILDKKEKKL